MDSHDGHDNSGHDYGDEDGHVEDGYDEDGDMQPIAQKFSWEGKDVDNFTKSILPDKTSNAELLQKQKTQLEHATVGALQEKGHSLYSSVAESYNCFVHVDPPGPQTEVARRNALKDKTLQGIVRDFTSQYDLLKEGKTFDEFLLEMCEKSLSYPIKCEAANALKNNYTEENFRKGLDETMLELLNNDNVKLFHVAALSYCLQWNISVVTRDATVNFIGKLEKPYLLDAIVWSATNDGNTLRFGPVCPNPNKKSQIGDYDEDPLPIPVKDPTEDKEIQIWTQKFKPWYDEAKQRVETEKAAKQATAKPSPKRAEILKKKAKKEALQYVFFINECNKLSANMNAEQLYKKFSDALELGV